MHGIGLSTRLAILHLCHCVILILVVQINTTPMTLFLLFLMLISGTLHFILQQKWLALFLWLSWMPTLTYVVTFSIVSLFLIEVSSTRLLQRAYSFSACLIFIFVIFITKVADYPCSSALDFGGMVRSLALFAWNLFNAKMALLFYNTFSKSFFTIDLHRTSLRLLWSNHSAWM